MSSTSTALSANLRSGLKQPALAKYSSSGMVAARMSSMVLLSAIFQKEANNKIVLQKKIKQQNVTMKCFPLSSKH